MGSAGLFTLSLVLLVTPCMMWGGKEGAVSKGEGCECAEGDWKTLCSPLLHTSCIELREEKDLLLMLPIVYLSLWESDGGYFL